MDGKNSPISIRRQADLLSVNRSSHYCGPPKSESEENLKVMRFMDEVYLEHPQLGVLSLVALMLSEGVVERVGAKRVRRLRRKMGLQTVYRRRRTTIPDPGKKVAGYLLRDLTIDRPNQVWCTDITYVPMRRGFLYLTVIMDWHSRRVLAWRLSNSLDVRFCLEALHEAVRVAGAAPEILNSDQGCQYTSDEWRSALKGYGIRQSMDGKGRWIDNVVIERFWRTIKYDDLYLRDYADGIELHRGIERFVRFYNSRRPHHSLGKETPDAVYFQPAAPAA